MSVFPTRRQALAVSAGLALGAAPPARLRLCTFSADVTVPPGHALMGGGIQPARKVDDPLFAHGFVLRGAGAPVASPRRVSHVGVGQAKVERVASNRRYHGRDGKPAFGRTSASRDPFARRAPEGTVDPFLKVLSLWDGEQPLLALCVYATHP